MPEKDQLIFVAGAKKEGGKLLTNGGRVLGVTEIADTLPEAIAKSYEAVKTVKFDNAFYRNDIGKKGPCGGGMKWFIESMLKKSRV